MAGPATTLRQITFAGGEISPALWARIDQAKYQSGLATCRNFFTRKEGGASNRSGTKFVCPLRAWENQYARGIPFEFNNEQAYVLLFTPLRIAFLRNGAPIMETATNITGITAANPPVVTSVGHGYVDGDMVYIDGVVGMTQVNGRFFTVNQLTVDTYALQEEANVNGTGYTAYSSGGTARRLYSIASPYAGADLALIRYKQSADVMILVHPDYAPQTLSRIAETNWAIAATSFSPDIDAPATGSGSGTGGGDTVRYQVTAVAQDTGEESFPGTEAAQSIVDISWNVSDRLVEITSHGYSTGDRVRISGTTDPLVSFLEGNTYAITVVNADLFTLDDTFFGGGPVIVSSGVGTAARTAIVVTSVTFPTAVNPITVTWGAVSGALEYNVYREVNGIYAYIGTAASTTFEDLGYSADPFDTPPIDFDLFSLSGYPGAVGFFQQRLVLGGFAGDPERVRASRTGLFFNFTQSNPIQADDAISFIVASGKVNEVKHFEELERLIVFTQGNAITIEGDEAGTLTPTGINPRIRSSNGAGDVAPLPAGTTVLYVEYQGNVVNELVPNQVGQAFNVRDVTVYAPHLFEGRNVVDWTWASKPFNIAWAVQDNGQMLGFTYLREQEIWGWHRHDTGDGDEFVGVTAIPEGGESAVYPLVRRYECNGQTRIYAERMATRLVSHAADGRFLDSYREQEDANDDAAMTFELYYNDDISDDDRFWIAPTGTTPPFTEGEASPDNGRVILLYGPDGERLWCTITAVNTTAQAFVSIVAENPEWITVSDGNQSPNDGLGDDGNDDDTEPFPLTLPFETDDWSQSVATVTDAWHLEGREVSIIGDGVPLGTATVVNGSFALPSPAVIVAYGLGITADLLTLEADSVEAEANIDKGKSTAQVTLRLDRSLGFQVGLQNGRRQTFEEGWARPGTFEEGSLFTGVATVYCEGQQGDTGQIAVRQTSPLPVTLVGIYPRLQVGESV